MARGKKKEKLTLEEKLEQALVPVEEWPYEVPENWCWTTVKNISDVVSKGTTPLGGKKVYIEDGIEFLRVENFLDNGTISHEGIAHISEDIHLGELKRSILKKDDVLVSIAGTLGKTAIVQGYDLPINTNQAVAFIRLNSKTKILPKYLRFLFDSPMLQNHLLGKVKVTSIPNLTIEIISNCPIPLPPLSEQQRIVERIEALFAKLDEAKVKLQEVIDGYAIREVSLLQKAVSGELTQEWREKNGLSKIDWKTISLKDCGTWFGGGTPTTSKKEYWDEGTIPWITSKDMKDKLIEDSLLHITQEGVNNSSARYCNKPAVLFVIRSGILRRILPVCMVKVPFTVNQDLKAVIPEKIQQEYMYWACKAYEKDIRENCMKSGTTVESIEAKKLLDYKLPLPDEREQKEIVDVIETLMCKEEIAKETTILILKRIDVMKKLILDKAFRGKLGTNNLEEESAIEMLKTIFVER